MRAGNFSRQKNDTMSLRPESLLVRGSRLRIRAFRDAVMENRTIIGKFPQSTFASSEIAVMIRDFTTYP
jgi:hypothetical protein